MSIEYVENHVVIPKELKKYLIINNRKTKFCDAIDFNILVPIEETENLREVILRKWGCVGNAYKNYISEHQDKIEMSFDTAWYYPTMIIFKLFELGKEKITWNNLYYKDGSIKENIYKRYKLIEKDKIAYWLYEDCIKNNPDIYHLLSDELKNDERIVEIYEKHGKQINIIKE